VTATSQNNPTQKPTPMTRTLRALKLLLLRWTGWVPAHWIRRLLYRMLAFRYPASTVVYGGAEIRSPKSIHIGEGTVIGNGAILDGRRGLHIGRRVNFSTGVWVWTLQHDFRSPDFADDGGPVTIGDYAWISCRVVVLPGVTIGEGAVVAAGAVVTKDVPPYSVVAGVPAKVVAERPQGLRYELGEKGPTPFI
jgi:acetyltransferase-like isoleucine patch superfamily enzyme